MVVDEFFVHGHVRSLKSTLKPFLGLLLTNPLSPKKYWIWQWNDILEILPFKLLLLENEKEDVKVIKISLEIKDFLWHTE